MAGESARERCGDTELDGISETDRQRNDAVPLKDRAEVGYQIRYFQPSRAPTGTRHGPAFSAVPVVSQSIIRVFVSLPNSPRPRIRCPCCLLETCVLVILYLLFANNPFDLHIVATSALPAPAAQASKAALTAGMADAEKPANGKLESTSEEGEVQELEVDMETQADQIRTVFSDPTNFNVKVRDEPLTQSFATQILADAQYLQHPLFSSWTLWFDSPATKGRNLPQTPALNSAFPSTPLPGTPGGAGAAAMGWMEDIKRVISIDSVEEFWG